MRIKLVRSILPASQRKQPAARQQLVDEINERLLRVVDAAAQLPPVSNLWMFTQMGAALAVFSGGAAAVRHADQDER